MKNINGLILFTLLCLLFLGCSHSEQIFDYWQNGVSEPHGIADSLEREVERKHYFYDTDLRYDSQVIHSENPAYFSTYY